ncbi:MAG: DNA-binding response regulator, partial [Alistipes sp.]|nr:DNA-binding response regulator [Alistipes sp.]
MRDFILSVIQEITRKGLEALLPGLGLPLGKVTICSDRTSLSAGLCAIGGDAVVILDYTLLDFYGVEQLQNVASRYGRSSWIIFCEELGRAFIRNICAHGRFSLVMKGDTLAEISEAITTAYRYGTYISESARRMVDQASAVDQTERLTLSEVSILREIALGRTTKEIASGGGRRVDTVN